MTGGWDEAGAVGAQNAAQVAEERQRMAALRRVPVGDSLADCAQRDEPIPEARRRAIPGVKLCVDCQAVRDRRAPLRGGINRRGTRDSPLG